MRLAPALGVLVLISFTGSGVARAAPPSDRDAMAGHMQDWFDGERAESYVFLGAGVLSLGGGVYLATRDDDFARGAGYSTAGVGGLLTLFAITYTLSLSPKHEELERDLARDPATYQRRESARMQAIADRFVLYRWIEIGVLAVGAGLIGYGLADDQELVTGIGTGLAGEASLLLVLDYFAERRAHTYLDHLRDFSPNGSATRSFTLKTGGVF